MQDEFVAYPSPWRRALLTMIAAGFVALGLWMIGAFGPPPTSHRYSESETIAIGWASVLFFGLCGIVGVAKIFDTNEQLRINAAGIRYAGWSSKTIPWHEIIDVTEWTYRRQKVIVLHLRNPALYPGRGTAGLLASANRKLTGGDVAITLTGTDRSFNDAMSAVARYRNTR
ncbi:hypothetical protein HZF05_13485 [Sphingomonas sp. CGMCC 1.13654]|uniref:PH domain-containing protein n=1 Tax=Sphingomonas chungangi TaxID=2683589 RepID=A0A838L7V8_9SPHN|nr:STM3941 family protein [Sphingomonas chungangi]MBA2935107.1 hypothetical protein [Sphingomonas chungangi]MVW54223.1 hypothetical protein [Sphingomonas chungangi]